jgi:hypothetical protein
MLLARPGTLANTKLPWSRTPVQVGRDAIIVGD